MGRNIALVSYCAPPNPGVASHRVLRLTRLLLAEGHRVHWVTLALDAVCQDETLLQHTPPEVVRHGFGGPCLIDQPAAKSLFGKVLRTIYYHLPRHFATPDGYVEWNRRLKRNLARTVQENSIDTLFVTCGPHGQITALPRVRKAAPSLRILVDYRDLLSGNLWQAGSARMRARLVRRERDILSLADHLFVNTEHARLRFLKLVQPPERLSVTVMRNAADYALGEAIIAQGDPIELGDGIHLGYFGTIFERRRLRPVLEAINALPLELGARIRLHAFSNDWSMGILDEDCRAVGGVAAQAVVKHKPVAYGVALRTMRAMDVLLLMNGPTDEDRIFIPGKLFDYLMARRPVAFVGQRGDAWQIVADVSGKDWCSRHDEPERLQALLMKLGEGRVPDTEAHDAYGPTRTFQPLLRCLE